MNPRCSMGGVAPYYGKLGTGGDEHTAPNETVKGELLHNLPRLRLAQVKPVHRRHEQPVSLLRKGKSRSLFDGFMGVFGESPACPQFARIHPPNLHILIAAGSDETWRSPLQRDCSQFQ